MFDGGRTRLFFVATLAVVGMALSHQAIATETCQGSYATALLHPLPPRMVVGVDILDRTPRNVDLSQRFLAGIRDAGVAVGAQPNVLRHITASTLGKASTQSGRGTAQSQSGMFGLQGGLQPGPPALPSTGFAASRSPPAPPLLFFRADATAVPSTRVAWIASIQCQMTSSNEGQLAEDLGRVVGSALGERTERRPF
jgi:hypothetical protein